ncbi:anti-sigma-I factor RsgI6-like [Haliotis rubra]|uniref:anti-sigma-I factor RsgI6-like n=1 Tax=Haliotis rubra TaxID=36100 RepID=UPI001EE6360E|nr:anti-sigma-I factor RsgI6-like [Haliotis rubra]
MAFRLELRSGHSSISMVTVAIVTSSTSNTVLENDLKWQMNARHSGAAHYDTAVEALNKLRSNGHRANAHCLLWSKVDKVPPWVRPLRGNTLRKAVTHRISEALNKTKGLVEHWDVNNEILHTQWFRETLQDRDYNLEVFRIAHQVDPSMKLFFNENTVTARGGDTMAYRDMAMRFKQAGVPVHGMGVQTHFRDLTAPDPYLLKKRLDLLAQVGLPLWVTELDLYSPDVNKRADWYETALRSLFGHPAVDGIMLWGFWSEQQWRGEPASLVSGPNFQVNAAGQRFFDLLEKEWMTNMTTKISHAHRQIEVRGFHGDYELTATYHGRPIQTKDNIYSGKNGHSCKTAHS